MAVHVLQVRLIASDGDKCVIEKRFRLMWHIHNETAKYAIRQLNSGDWNRSDHNSGCFCTENGNIKMFDKNCNWTYADWLRSDARAILCRCPLYTDESNKKDKVTKADVRQKWWNNLSEGEKNAVMSLPNFDADKFYLCTGIKVNEED